MIWYSLYAVNRVGHINHYMDINKIRGRFKSSAKIITIVSKLNETRGIPCEGM